MNIKIPEAFQEIFEPYRMKCWWGGRGAAKSESVGRYLLAEGTTESMNIVCGREYQSSIRDSVYSMLEYLIEDMELQDYYEVLQSEIRGKKNKTLISFVGLKRNINNIKSMHNVRKFWGEEAHSFSQRSLDIIFPTIRAEGSELIFTMNPELEDDPAYQYLIANPPPNSLVRKVNYTENPFFPEVLRVEMEHMKKKEPDKYRNIWLGECLAAVEGAIFAKDLEKAVLPTDQYPNGRITNVPYDKSKPVDIHYDLGRGDKTAMWFIQIIGYEIRLIDYYENNGEHFSHYIKYAQDSQYVLGNHYLPHDAEAETISAEKSVKRQAINAYGSENVKIVKRIPKKAMAIEAARSIIDRCVWDKVRCADGLTCLRKYAHKVDPDTGRTSREPEHDTPWSHGSDAFMSIGQTLKEFVKKKKKKVFNKPKINYLPRPAQV